MDEIIHVKNSSYARYEELLIRRDNLRKEAFAWDKEYIRVFGDKILKVFELKLECIRKKKTIAFCQAALNHGNEVNQEELREYLDREMAEYQQKLEAMIEENDSAKSGHEISEVELLEIKKIYRRLAKKLHPDINPKTSENEKLMDIWQRISIAYKCNDLKGLNELEILATSALSEIIDGKLEVEIPDIDTKIAEILAEIENIRNTDPYMYKYILENEDAVKEKNAALDEEYASYEEYEKQFDEILNQLMASGMTFKWRL